MLWNMISYISCNIMPTVCASAMVKCQKNSVGLDGV